MAGLISSHNDQYLATGHNKSNSILIEGEIIQDKTVKSLFLSNGKFREVFSNFFSEENEFTLQGYKNFLYRILEKDNLICEEINKIILKKYEGEITSVLNLLHFFVIIAVGFVLQDFLQNLRFINDVFEEKRHSLYVLVSAFYFLLILLFLKTLSREDFNFNGWKVQRNSGDEYSGITIKL
jgi:hypothetical protein